MPFLFLVLPLFSLLISGCAAANALGFHKLEAPPEFNQKILLQVSDDYQMHQAPRSGYDIGDLQSFHSQHTLPVVIEDAFKEIFGSVDVVEKGPRLEVERPDVPAIFEVRLLDVGHDTYIEGADHYRSDVTLAVAMKSPRDHIFWQQAFRGQGYVPVEDQFSTHMGPQDAVIEAVRNAVEQMQDAILKSPQVRTQLKYYKDAEEARKKAEVPV